VALQSGAGQGTFYTRQHAQAQIDSLHTERAQLRAWIHEHEPAWRAERQRQLLDGATDAMAYALLRRMGNVYDVRWIREDWVIIVTFGESLTSAAGQLAAHETTPAPEPDEW
jgi:hypothetical protein